MSSLHARVANAHWGGTLCLTGMIHYRLVGWQRYQRQETFRQDEVSPHEDGVS